MLDAWYISLWSVYFLLFIQSKYQEIRKLREQLSDKKAQMKIEWRKILTPEQIAKL